MLMQGAEIIIECLKEQGVDTVFGYPGGTVISVYDALFRNGSGIRHVLTSHEQGAAHAADGYARATGKTGVCLVTSGPGATNLVTGIATAYMDSVPLVAITINVPLYNLGKDSFQEVDIAGITMPVTKHNFIIKDIKNLAPKLRRAFKIAASGRPGPVLVDITRDVTEGYTEYEAIKEPASELQNEYITEPAGSENKKKFAKLLNAAKAPLLLVGGGSVISGAAKEVRSFVDRYPLPVADTLMGKGLFGGNEKEYLGMVGLYGAKAANDALSGCDLLIALGCRFSERVLGCEAFPKEVRVIQIDIDRAELNKNIKDELAVCGDIKAVLAELSEAVEPVSVTKAAARRKWLEGCLRNKEELRREKDRELEGSFSGPAAVRTVYEVTEGRALVATEVGLNQMWAAQEYIFSHARQLLTSGGLGTMGYGLGAAIGAQLGLPEALVINIAGDGCFRMNMNELLTAKANNLPIIDIILDNQMLGMVHLRQDIEYGGRHSQTEFTDNADYAAIAAACGAKSCTVTCKEELKEALEAAISSRTLSVIVCRI